MYLETHAHFAAVGYRVRQLHDNLFEPTEVWNGAVILDREWKDLPNGIFRLSLDD
jgi:hypothetical protein